MQAPNGHHDLRPCEVEICQHIQDWPQQRHNQQQEDDVLGDEHEQVEPPVLRARSAITPVEKLGFEAAGDSLRESEHA